MSETGDRLPDESESSRVESSGDIDQPRGQALLLFHSDRRLKGSQLQLHSDAVDRLSLLRRRLTGGFRRVPLCDGSRPASRSALVQPQIRSDSTPLPSPRCAHRLDCTRRHVRPRAKYRSLPHTNRQPGAPDSLVWDRAVERTMTQNHADGPERG